MGIKTNRRRSIAGQAFLSTVLIIGGMMIVISAAIAILAATFVDSGYGLQASSQAGLVATAGVNDAFLRLVRTGTGTFAGPYSVTVPAGTATVSVSSSTGQVTVFSVATVSGRTRKINAVFAVSPSTGQVTLALWQYVQ